MQTDHLGTGSADGSIMQTRSLSSNEFSQEELAPALDSLDDATNYADWIIDEVKSFVGQSILEVGAGTGTMSQRLSKLGVLTAAEPVKQFADQLTDRFSDDDSVSVLCADLTEATHVVSADGIVMVNVLEHIENDAKAVQECFNSLEDGGHLVVFVPAFMLLFSDFDSSIGHFRRYRRRQLEELFEKSGFDIVCSKYMNLPGWFAWLILARLFRRPPAVGRKVALYDRAAIPLIRKVESRVRVPFGQSLLVVGKKQL